MSSRKTRRNAPTQRSMSSQIVLVSLTSAWLWWENETLAKLKLTIEAFLFLPNFGRSQRFFWTSLDIETKLKKDKKVFSSFQSMKVQFWKVHNIQKHKNVKRHFDEKDSESFSSRPDILKILFSQWEWNFFLFRGRQLKWKFRSHEVFFWGAVTSSRMTQSRLRFAIGPATETFLVARAKLEP